MFKYPLKHAFNLPNSSEKQEIDHLTSEVHANYMVLDGIKKDIAELLGKRTIIINKLLLSKYKYLIKSTDYIIYNDQLGEIHVFDGGPQEDVFAD
jgi:hypothetical protein